MKSALFALLCCFVPAVRAAEEPLLPAGLNALLPKIHAGMTIPEVEGALSSAYAGVKGRMGIWSGQTGYVDYKLDDRFTLSVSFMTRSGKEVVHDETLLCLYDVSSKRRVDLKIFDWQKKQEGKPAAVEGGILPATVSPSGRYRLASAEVTQSYKEELKQSIGASVTLIGPDGTVLSKCFIPDAMPYLDANREDWQTKAYWNGGETMAAVYSGGHTWSRVDFYSIGQDHLAVLPHLNWNYFLQKYIKGYAGKTTRLFETSPKWIDKDTCVLTLGGTAFVDESQKERYPSFSFAVTVKIASDAVRIVEVKESRE